MGKQRDSLLDISSLSQSPLEILYAALGETYGVVVATSNPALARQKLYQARAKSGDPDLAHLQIRVNPMLPDRELFVVQGPKESK